MEISWEAIGISFSIPPGAVPEDTPLLLTVQPCLTGPFHPPDKYQFTSPSYIVSPEFQFTKDIKMVVHHFINLSNDDDCARMTFLSAPSSPTYEGHQPQYRFKVLRRGVFHKKEKFGTISLRHFCVITTGAEGKPIRMFNQYNGLHRARCD